MIAFRDHCFSHYCAKVTGFTDEMMGLYHVHCLHCGFNVAGRYIDETVKPLAVHYSA